MTIKSAMTALKISPVIFQRHLSNQHKGLFRMSVFENVSYHGDKAYPSPGFLTQTL